MPRRFIHIAAVVLVSLAAAAYTVDMVGAKSDSVKKTVLETFSKPWAMTFLPDGRALVTEKGGTLWLVGQNGKKFGRISGVPSAKVRGQGGLGDIILHPDYATNNVVYLSFVEPDANDSSRSGAAVVRAKLSLTEASGNLTNSEIIWRQVPKVTGSGHFGHRMAFAPDGHLFITSGERQKFDPAQDMSMNLGKIIRLTDTGGIPADNPFVAQGGVAAEVWSLGHRNPLGIAFAKDGQLWAHEMGPRGGDELNQIVRAANYGYPEVSEGSHYSGIPIPSHSANASHKKPAIAWVPSISPAGLIIYDGDDFPEWKGNILMGGLSGRALLRIIPTITGATEAERIKWGKRIREVEQGPDGTLYVLEDGKGGRLLRLDPPE